MGNHREPSSRSNILKLLLTPVIPILTGLTPTLSQTSAAFENRLLETPSYKTVTIAGRTWMARNLDVVTYRNGDSIPHVSDTYLWQTQEAGAWCHYGNDSFYARSLGRLYNWKAVTDPRGLCPTGWHVPDSREWLELADSLGGMDEAGGALKSTVNWSLPNAGATNSSGFGAVPGGYRFENGFSYVGETGYWWCNDEEDESLGRSIAMMYRERGVYSIGNDKKMGLSVRCVKDPR